MKRIIFISILSFFTLSSIMGQTRKEKKAERKALQDSVQQADYLMAIHAISDTLMILEADQAFDRRGRSVFVEPTLNFVKFDKQKGVVQLSFPSLIGPNGVGGITLSGDLSTYEIKKDKKGRIYLKASTFGGSMTADIFITLNTKSNDAEAVVSSSTLPYKVRFVGEIKHLSQSYFFEGTSRF